MNQKPMFPLVPSSMGLKRSPSRIRDDMSWTAPGPCGLETEEDFEDAPTSFMVSKYWVPSIISMTSLAVVPGTFSEKASTLSLSPSTIAWRWRAMPSPDKYFDSASPSARLICYIFSASAFSFAATLNLAAVVTVKGKKNQYSNYGITHVLSPKSNKQIDTLWNSIVYYSLIRNKA